jgi:pSer/pThr/pTyr-binding forkhead associated (FHA) protein
MNLLKIVIKKFMNNEMIWEYTLKNGTLIQIGDQKFKNKSFHKDYDGEIGKVSIKVNGEKVTCPIYRDESGKFNFVFENEKILFKDLTHVG